MSDKAPAAAAAAAATTANGAASDDVKTLAAPAALRAERSLRMASVNSRVLALSHAVRGPLTLRAIELDEQLNSPDYVPGTLPFDEVIFSNIGNPQSLGQRPVTFFRQVLAHVYTAGASSANGGAPADVVARGDELIAALKGAPGAYSHTLGCKRVRESVAAFITKRDGGAAASADEVFLTDGASAAVRHMLTLLVNNAHDGVLVPCPQYSMYGATLGALGGTVVNYALDESRNWAIDPAELERAYIEATDAGVAVRALVIINPGNPTAQVLDEAALAPVVTWATERNVLIIADEVYQVNVYDDALRFTSVRAVADRLYGSQPAAAQPQVASLHSVSKGVYGECGVRGGYVHLTNVDPDVRHQLYKLLSVQLCANVAGQICMDCMVRPPADGDASAESHKAELDTLFASLKRRAGVVHKMLNELEGVSCTPLTGSLYAFPSISMPARAVDRARGLDIAPDALYARELLEATGICVVAGSGFGQADGTHHVRATILPPEDKVEKVAKLWRTFHADFMKKYADA